MERFRVNEVIVAAREQRGGAMPLNDLLECRVAGVPVCDLSAFYERMRGEVPVDSLKASWLIYGAGFDQNALRRLVKRTSDVVAATFLLMLALPVSAAGGCSPSLSRAACRSSSRSSASGGLAGGSMC